MIGTERIAAPPAPSLRRWIQQAFRLRLDRRTLDPDSLTDHLRRDLGFTDGPARPFREGEW